MAFEANDTNPIASLSRLWAKKYVQKLLEPSDAWKTEAKDNRVDATNRLREALRTTSAQAWTKTESLLAKEVKRHGIDYKLIDPWEIARDTYYVYEKALSAYSKQVLPRQLSVLISADLGNIRKKHTDIDPRVIGFVSLQFHYTGQLLLQLLPSKEQAFLSAYFKVIDDHLYMPLQRSYNAAANHDYNSPELEIVRKLLPESSKIAESIVQRAIAVYPNYQCFSGTLSSETVQISSRRDVEMFQVYLWVCILEGEISAVQEELFPLCVMLYPMLKVNWELVRQMLHLLNQEVNARLDLKQLKLFQPYFQALWYMFSPEVFANFSQD